MKRTEEVPEWRRSLRDTVGEDPGRFLDRDLLDENARMLAKSRIRGIERFEREPPTNSDSGTEGSCCPECGHDLLTKTRLDVDELPDPRRPLIDLDQFQEGSA